MKVRYFLIAAAMLTGMTAMAQETYENAKIATEDLNGTARYVGMGGALDALGADISTISSNPAGIGLFKHPVVSASFGFVSQQDAEKSTFVDGTNVSFDQVGFVYVNQTRSNSFFNVGFNYHKSRNFDFILSAANQLENASQNKLTYEKGANGLIFGNNGKTLLSCNQLDAIYVSDLLNYSKEIAEDGTPVYSYYPATDFTFNRGHKGYIGEYDINFSGNIHDRIFLGMTVGIHDVHYKHYGEYTEQLVGNDEGISSVAVADERKITGAGVDIKAGVIVRPIETSPFRIGLSVSTPIWYDLKTTNFTQVGFKANAIPPAMESYKFRLNTPWKFGLSLGHTIGNMVAIGAGVDYADYSYLDSRVDDGEYYDYYWDEYYSSSSSDKNMNDHTERTLKGVATVKLGVEVKPIPELAFRLGFNTSTPMYDKEGQKDGTIQSNGSYYSSATDYTNWKATNRITAGVGYTAGKMSFDLAYQYASTSGEFYPFQSYYEGPDSPENILCNSTKVENKRHQLLLTLGYHF